MNVVWDGIASELIYLLLLYGRSNSKFTSKYPGEQSSGSLHPNRLEGLTDMAHSPERQSKLQSLACWIVRADGGCGFKVC